MQLQSDVSPIVPLRLRVYNPVVHCNNTGLQITEPPWQHRWEKINNSWPQAGKVWAHDSSIVAT